MKNYQDIFAENIKAYRKFFGISQEKLAHLSGLDMSYIGRIERKVVCPTLVTINKLCNGLNVDVSLMFIEINRISFDDYALFKHVNGHITIKKIDANKIDIQTKKLLDAFFD